MALFPRNYLHPWPLSFLPILRPLESKVAPRVLLFAAGVPPFFLSLALRGNPWVFFGKLVFPERFPDSWLKVSLRTSGRILAKVSLILAFIVAPKGGLSVLLGLSRFL